MEQIWQKLKTTWHNAPDLIFFWILVFCIPFGTRSILGTLVLYSSTMFNEWTSAFLYGTDILVVLILIFWLRRLARFHPTFAKHGRALNILVLAFALIALVSAVLSPFWGLGIYGAVKLIEFGLIFLYGVYNIVTYRRRLLTCLLIFASGGIQAIIAIFQFINQSSLGLTLLGESPLGTYIPNVAEVVFAGEPILRAYGTLPHPNVLAYFLVISLFLGGYVFWRVREPYMRLSVTFLAGLQFLALLLTFSRVAWLALGLGVIVAVIMYAIIQRERPRTQKLWNPLAREFQQKILWVCVILFLIMALSSIVVLAPLLDSRMTVADNEGDMAGSFRQYLNAKALQFGTSAINIGWGPKSFVPMLTATENFTLPDWMKQPVHNVWLGIFSEIGMWGLIAFTGILVVRVWQILKPKTKTVPRGTVSREAPDNLLRALILGIIAASVLVMFFDHYILDVQQGSLAFFILLGL